jgi:hypothetical protein
MLIDTYMPDHQFMAAYSIEIDAAIEHVYPIVRKMDLRNAPLLRVIFWLRSIPGMITGHNPLGPTLEVLERAGMTVLEETPPQELLMGFVGKIWTATGGIQKLTPADFRDFSDPDVAKVVWNFSLEPMQDGRTRVTTETRVQCFSAQSRKKLARYAFFIRPVSGMTRKSALRAIKRQAESQPSTTDRNLPETTR